MIHPLFKSATLYVDSDHQSPDETMFTYRGTSLSELHKIFNGGEFGAYWGPDFDYSSDFANGYEGGGEGAVMVADQKTNGKGRMLIPDPKDVVAILEPHTARVLWERSTGFHDKEFEAKFKTNSTVASTPEVRTVLHPFKKEPYGGVRAFFEMTIGSDDVAYCEVIKNDEDVAQTENLNVSQSFRGKGYAKLMYKELFKKLKSMGFKEVESSDLLQPGGEGVWQSLSREFPIKQDGDRYRLKLAAAEDKFLFGGCAAFAIELQKKIGGELYTLNQGEKPMHAFVRRDGQSFDVKGQRGTYSMALGFFGGADNINVKGPFTAETLPFKSKDNPKLREQAAAYIAAHPKLASHKVTPFDRNEFQDPNKDDPNSGEGTNSYSVIPQEQSGIYESAPIKDAIKESSAMGVELSVEAFNNAPREDLDIMKGLDKEKLDEDEQKTAKIAMEGSLLYHGTSIETAKKIVQEGMPFNAPKKSYWLIPYLPDAQHYGNIAARALGDKEYAVVRIDGLIVGFTPANLKALGERNAIVSSNVPAEAVLGYDVYPIDPEYAFKTGSYYFGTDTVGASEILQKGMDPGFFLTTKLDTAKWHANRRMQETGNDPVVLEVELSPEQEVKLQPDPLEQREGFYLENTAIAPASVLVKIAAVFPAKLKKKFDWLPAGAIGQDELEAMHSHFYLSDGSTVGTMEDHSGLAAEVMGVDDAGFATIAQFCKKYKAIRIAALGSLQFFQEPTPQQWRQIARMAQMTHGGIYYDVIANDSYDHSGQAHSVGELMRRIEEAYTGKVAKQAMKINVPEQALDHFWVEPPAGSMEFWAFRFPPKAKVGDQIIFNIDKKPVATATIALIEAPGQSECEQTGNFRNRWKVYWTQESFKKTAAEMFNGGSLTHRGVVTYWTPNKEMAESYVDMYNDRYGKGGKLNVGDINVKNPASAEVISAEATKLGIDNEMYTPASIFDINLHGQNEVKALVRALRGMGYDGAILDDIAYGKQISAPAYIVFN